MALISSNLRFLKLIIVLSISLLSTIPKSTSIPNYLYNFCSNTTLFAPNSKYHKNLNTVFQSLSSNTTNPDGFHITDSGTNTTNAVYGLFLCRGDQNSSSCSDCVTTATTTDLPYVCPHGKHAVIWYDECMVRYSNESLHGKMAIKPGEVLWNKSNLTGSQMGFSEILDKAIGDVVNRTADNLTRKKYATSQVNLSSFDSLYTLGQCTPDLTVFDCTKCLVAATFYLKVSDSGRVLQPSCNLRYATYPFFSSLSTPPPPPPSSPAPALPPVPAPAPLPIEISPDSKGRTTKPAEISPGPSASGKTTLSPHLNTILGFGIFVIVNFYYRFM